MKFVHRALVALAAFAAASVAIAAYPDRPITFVVPWGAGGGTDGTARYFAAMMEKELGQPVNVVNRTGGGGVVGHSAIAQAPAHLSPWFDIPGRRTAGTPVAFGHWSTLGTLDRPDLLALDTGCVWGGRLTAARVDGGRRELVGIDCAQALAPF